MHVNVLQGGILGLRPLSPRMIQTTYLIPGFQIRQKDISPGFFFLFLFQISNYVQPYGNLALTGVPVKIGFIVTPIFVIQST
jgi:hypothetical protein